MLWSLYVLYEWFFFATIVIKEAGVMKWIRIVIMAVDFRLYFLMLIIFWATSWFISSGLKYWSYIPFEAFAIWCKAGFKHRIVTFWAFYWRIIILFLFWWRLVFFRDVFCKEIKSAEIVIFVEVWANKRANKGAVTKHICIQRELRNNILREPKDWKGWYPKEKLKSGSWSS